MISDDIILCTEMVLYLLFILLTSRFSCSKFSVESCTNIIATGVEDDGGYTN